MLVLVCCELLGCEIDCVIKILPQTETNEHKPNMTYKQLKN